MKCLTMLQWQPKNDKELTLLPVTYIFNANKSALNIPVYEFRRIFNENRIRIRIAIASTIKQLTLIH